MDPGQEKQDRNRGAALWGNFVITAAGGPPRIIATDKNTGRVAWETTFADTPEVNLTSAPLPVRDKIMVGAAGGDNGVRDWMAGLDAKTGKLLWRTYTVPAPGEPGSETWKDKNNAWRTGGGAIWVTGTYDPATHQTIWGTGNPVPMYDPTYRPGDNLFTNSAISFDPDTGKMNWYFQYTPGDMWDYDEVGTHILIDDVVAGQPRKLITHSARNGFLYTMERASGAMVSAKPYMEVNWTKGIDQKTGKPIDYDPNKDIQTYSGLANQTLAGAKKACPGHAGGNNFWPSAYSPRTKLIYVPALSNCEEISLDPTKHSTERGWNGGAFKTAERYESNLTALDPVTGEIKKNLHLRYPNYAGAMTTAGGLVFVGLLDGTVAAYDDTTLDRAVEVQCRRRFLGPADELRGQRQAVCGDRLGREPGRALAPRQHAGAQGPAQRHDALRVRAVENRGAVARMSDHLVATSGNDHPGISPRRGRDEDYSPPPARIRTCSFPAYGSYLGWLTAKRWLGQGWRIRG